MVIAFLLLDEPLTLNALVGLALTGFAVFLVRQRGRNEEVEGASNSSTS